MMAQVTIVSFSWRLFQQSCELSLHPGRRPRAPGPTGTCRAPVWSNQWPIQARWNQLQNRTPNQQIMGRF